MRTPQRSHVGANTSDAAHHEPYLLSREAERKRAQLHREAEEKCSEPWEIYFQKECQCFRYCETQEELDLERERLYINWFRQLLIEELKRPRNLKRVRQPAPSRVSHLKARLLNEIKQPRKLKHIHHPKRS